MSGGKEVHGREVAAALSEAGAGTRIILDGVGGGWVETAAVMELEADHRLVHAGLTIRVVMDPILVYEITAGAEFPLSVIASQGQGFRAAGAPSTRNRHRVTAVTMRELAV